MPRAVDAHYQLTAATRRFLARRARLHRFDVLAPEVTEQASAAIVRRRPAGSGTWLELELRGPLRLRRGDTALLVLGATGFSAAHAPGCVVSVGGEELPARPDEACASPCFGPLLVTATRPVVLKRLVGFQARPGQRLVDRYPVHLELWPGDELVVPLDPRRRRRPVEQLSVHWGSIAYTKPERRLPLGDWGYPYYLDGVLGDIGGLGPGGRRVLARGKFMEFDEVENVHGFAPLLLRDVFVRLRSRDGVPPVRPCRIAAIEVRYQAAPRSPLFHFDAPGEATLRRPLRFRLPQTMQVDRIDVTWRDEGPAMGALVAGRLRTPFVNVCTGERRVFEFTPARLDRFELHAALAPFRVDQLTVYGVAPA